MDEEVRTIGFDAASLYWIQMLKLKQSNRRIFWHHFDITIFILTEKLNYIYGDGTYDTDKIIDQYRKKNQRQHNAA